MNSKTAWITVLAASAAMVGGCSGPSASTGTSPTGTPAPAATSSQAPTPAVAPPGTEPMQGPITYTAPPAPTAGEDYAVAPGVDPAAAKACAALDVGPEIYAAIGKSTLSADSTASGAVEEVVCQFETAEHTQESPNFLAVATMKNGGSYFESIPFESIPGWAKQDIFGVGDKAKIYSHGSVEDQASHNMYVLNGSLMVSVQTVFRDIPDGADLSVHRYGAIAGKVRSQ